MFPESANERFRQMVAGPEETIDLAEAALLMACEEYPDLNVGDYLEQLDRMGKEVSGRLGALRDPEWALPVLNEYLFDGMGFHGNSEDYYDPRNSFLNDVLDRRTGIPITLSVVYMEVAGRARLPVFGVGLPGHFLVKYRSHDQEIFLDPFHRGSVLTREECLERVVGVYQFRVELDPVYFEAISPKMILMRMLNNLRGIYFGLRDHHRARRVLEKLLMIDPGLADVAREMGALCAAEGDFFQAVLQFERYLALVPYAPDAREVERQIDLLRRRMKRS